MTDLNPRPVNPEIDTTLIVNIMDGEIVTLKEKFTWYINKQAVELEPGERKEKPIYIAQVGAKHMVDKILQEAYSIKNTLQDTDLRRSLFAKILPNMAEERQIKPLTEEEFKKRVMEQLQKQEEVITSILGGTTQKAQVSELEKKVKELEEKLAVKEEKALRMQKAREAKRTKKEGKVASSE